MVRHPLDEDVMLTKENDMPKENFEEDYLDEFVNDDNLLDGDFETFGGEFDPATILIG